MWLKLINEWKNLRATWVPSEWKKLVGAVTASLSDLYPQMDKGPLCPHWCTVRPPLSSNLSCSNKIPWMASQQFYSSNPLRLSKSIKSINFRQQHSTNNSFSVSSVRSYTYPNLNNICTFLLCCKETIFGPFNIQKCCTASLHFDKLC